MNVCEGFAALAHLCCALDAAPPSQFPQCWELQVDDRWWIAFNGHEYPVTCTAGVTVEPFHCYIQFNGLPAGVFWPWGGIIAAGEVANEDAFLAAVKARMPA